VKLPRSAMRTNTCISWNRSMGSIVGEIRMMLPTLKQ
jgi:hypothetical protein